MTAEHDPLAVAISEYYDDPLGYVLDVFPWGHGELAHATGPDEWQTEALRQIGEEVRARRFDGKTAVSPIRFCRASGHDIGKALSNRTLFHTPAGLREWGSLRPGDLVFAEDGSATEITGVFPQGIRQMYRVRFDDGSEVEADADHIWKVRGRAQRRYGADNWVTMTTAELMAAGVTRSNGDRHCRQWEIPVQGAAQFRPQKLYTHPYTMGVWLGDGARNSSVITSQDMDIIERLRAVGEKVTQKPSDRDAWNVSMLKPRLMALGIAGCYSYEKHIPAVYMENSEDVRAEVLRGLLDTDGECGKQGSVTFSSTSRALALDVVWLARSLGGKARIQPTVKRPRYSGRDGEAMQGRECWRATVKMPAGFQCFYLARKQARTGSGPRRWLSRWIASVKPIGELPATCIAVEHPSHCFLANDFVVTHNTTIAAWIVCWIKDTREDSQGTITANTFTQLETKTWAAIKKWARLALTRDWWEIGATKMYHKESRDTWFVSCQSSSEENSEAFAGQHAIYSTSYYVFDEASAIPDEIWRVAEGGLTDGEPMIFAFGNPTRNTGMFYEACFGNRAHRWNHGSIDSRTSGISNKTTIEEWLQDYGEDSDFFRVRVRGLPPNTSESQLIPRDLVRAAMGRLCRPLNDEPLIAGVDVPDGGSAWFIVRFRRGADGDAAQPIRVTGSKIDRPAMIAGLARCCRDGVLCRDGKVRPLGAVFVDSAFGAPVVERLRTLGFEQVHEVRFGGKSPDPHFGNMRSFMWAKGVKEWLASGCLAKDDEKILVDLTGPGFHLNKSSALVLESKEDMMRRGVPSPDDGDALALTFAQKVAPVSRDYAEAERPAQRSWLA